MEENNYLHSELSNKILKAYFKVFNILGFGFLEKVYENAMMIELRKCHLNCEQQQLVDVYYDGNQVGIYYADIVVDGKIVLELKAAESLVPEHEAQLVNYLRATDMEVGLLLNFGKKPDFKRRVLTDDYKHYKK